MKTLQNILKRKQHEARLDRVMRMESRLFYRRLCNYVEGFIR